MCPRKISSLCYCSLYDTTQWWVQRCVEKTMNGRGSFTYLECQYPYSFFPQFSSPFFTTLWKLVLPKGPLLVFSFLILHTQSELAGQPAKIHSPLPQSRLVAGPWITFPVSQLSGATSSSSAQKWFMLFLGLSIKISCRSALSPMAMLKASGWKSLLSRITA